MADKYTSTPLTQWDTAANAGSNTNRINGYTVPQGVQFNREQRDYQLFPEEYFTSTDCQVYFNDVYIDDLTGLSFSLNETAEPIFGYASNTWDYFARGKRLVQGQFRIAFREAGYLWTLMDHFGMLGGQQLTHLAYLMNNETRNVYNGYNGAPKVTFGQVLENIEDLLTRTHLDQNLKYADTKVKNKQKAGYFWAVEDEPMKIGSSDSEAKHQNQEPDEWNYTTSVKQLQNWLIKNKYGFDKRSFTWKGAYGGDTWYKNKTWTTNADGTTNRSKQVAVTKNLAPYFNTAYLKNKIKKDGTIVPGGGRTGTVWYMCVRYWPDGTYGTAHQPIPGNTEAGLSYSNYELEFQQAVDRYPGGLEAFWMGSPDKKTMRYDGRYGSGPRDAIKMLHKLAEKSDGSDGLWVTEYTKDLLEQGLTSATGVYDFATKIAVWAFQSDMVKAGRLVQPSKDYYPNGKVDVATRDLMSYTIEVDMNVEGASLYMPGEAYESRMALYEREVWGHRFVEDAEAVRNLESFFYRGRRSDTTDKLYTEVLFQKGFDLYINYGPLSHYVKSKFEQYNVGDTLVGGSSLANDVSFNTTVKAIRNVQIYNVEQILDPNTGHCIEEVYSFIAKDLD